MPVTETQLQSNNSGPISLFQNGSPLMARQRINFLGSGVALTDDTTNYRTNVILRSEVVDITTYGAKGDGTTDDTNAINNAVSYAGSNAIPLYIPEGIFTTTTGIEINVQTTGNPLSIFGDGPNSVIKLTGTSNGGFHISGTSGTTINPVSIRNLRVSASNSGTGAFGIHLDGIAHWFVENIWVEGNSKCAKGFWLTAAQQGQISGGGISGCTIGGLLEDNAGGGVRSNGVDWHGMTFFNNTNINFQITSNSGSAGADDTYFHGNHLTSAAMQIDVYGGAGQLTFISNHIEPVASNNGIIIRGNNTRAAIISNTITGSATDLEISSGAIDCKVIGNLIDGAITIDSGATDTMLIYNSTGGVITDNGTRTRNFGNRDFSGTSLVGSNLYDNLIVTASHNASAGDILLLQPNSNGGNWGATIKGAGNGDIYYRMGSSGPIIAGSTADGNIHFKNAPGGTEWGFISPTGFTVTLLTDSSSTTTGALQSKGGAGIAKNAYVGGNLYFPTSGNGIAGTTMNDNASSGIVGEYVSSEVSNGSAVSMASTNTPYTITSISLNAGDWDVWGIIAFKPDSITTVSQVAAGINTAAATLPALGKYSVITATLTTGQPQAVTTVPTVFKLSGTTTIYLVAQAGFGVSTMAGYGGIYARRVR